MVDLEEGLPSGNDHVAEIEVLAGEGDPQDQENDVFWGCSQFMSLMVTRGKRYFHCCGYITVTPRIALVLWRKVAVLLAGFRANPPWRQMSSHHSKRHCAGACCMLGGACWNLPLEQGAISQATKQTLRHNPMFSRRPAQTQEQEVGANQDWDLMIWSELAFF